MNRRLISPTTMTRIIRDAKNAERLMADPNLPFINTPGSIPPVGAGVVTVRITGPVNDNGLYPAVFTYLNTDIDTSSSTQPTWFDGEVCYAFPLNSDGMYPGRRYTGRIEGVVKYLNPDLPPGCVPADDPDCNMISFAVVAASVDCCPAPDTCGVCAGTDLTSSMFVRKLSGGCYEFCTAGEQHGNPELFYNSEAQEWSNGYICSSFPPSPCMCVVAITLRCVDNTLVVDITRQPMGTMSSPQASHTGLPVTVQSCSPFCATFVVPADDACDESTTYQISNDPTFSGCGGSGDVVGPISRVDVGTASASSSSTSPMTMTFPGVSVDAGDTLVLCVGVVKTVASAGTLPTPSFAWSGAGGFSLAGSVRLGTPNDLEGRMYVLRLSPPSNTTGTVTITITSGTASYKWAGAIAYKVLNVNTLDQIVSDNGISSDISSGTTSPSTSPDAYVGGFAFYTWNVEGDGNEGAWQNSFLDGELVTGDTEDPAVFWLSDGYRIVSTVGTFEAAKNTFSVQPDQWAAAVVILRHS